jgi:glyoxylase-like metal-dependent hydrolase (beta-lactamase superfamily II)
LVNCQKSGDYEVYALKYLDGGTISGRDGIFGADPKDSLQLGFMIWLLKGPNGDNILVDAGFINSTKYPPKSCIRPDLVLNRIGISGDDITDIILTHPHNDHIGGINLFPKANICMQEDDFNYFIG